MVEDDTHHRHCNLFNCRLPPPSLLLLPSLAVPDANIHKEGYTQAYRICTRYVFTPAAIIMARKTELDIN